MSMPASTVVARFQDEEVFRQVVPASQVNFVILPLVSDHNNGFAVEDTIVETPGWGVRVFCQTNEGLITAVGNSEAEAMARVNAEFDLRDRASRKRAASLVPMTLNSAGKLVPLTGDVDPASIS